MRVDHGYPCAALPNGLYATLNAWIGVASLRYDIVPNFM